MRDTRRLDVSVAFHILSESYLFLQFVEHNEVAVVMTILEHISEHQLGKIAAHVYYGNFFHIAPSFLSLYHHTLSPVTL